jgi:aconitate hydratase
MKNIDPSEEPTMSKTALVHSETKKTIRVAGKEFTIFSFEKLSTLGLGDSTRLPTSLKILLENLIRQEDGFKVKQADIEAVINWDPKATQDKEIAFMPARVLLQDFTGVPAIVDLASMRQAVARMKKDPRLINPQQPVDLVIDHSVQVDRFASLNAFLWNTQIEVERNKERYNFLRWGQKSFRNFRAVPPGTGIVHQVNLEYLAQVVFSKTDGDTLLAYPDTLVGTDSHTPMVNGLGVVGWGVGGIEAEAAMLGQPISMLIPEVVGFKLEGELREGATATDLVLTVTEMLRKKGVVGKFVEFYGPGISKLSVADRATIGNMSPEYGATIGFFPVDNETLNYLRFTGRDEDLIALVESYCKEQGIFLTPDSPEPYFTATLSLDLGDVEPSIAGPKRPQDRVLLSNSKKSFRTSLCQMLESDTSGIKKEVIDKWIGEGGSPTVPAEEITNPELLGPITKTVTISEDSVHYKIRHGSVVIAAITSCTNTSNPSVMIAAGLLAKNAVRCGLDSKPWVKTSLAPGSKVVTDYLEEAGLTPYLEALGFHLVGYGCTTCIGNSGPLPERVAKAVKEGDLIVAAVLSGNRNFEGRINPLVRANYLASPPLVVAYALAGRMDIDLMNEPIGRDRNGEPVYLKDVWPTNEQVRDAIQNSVKSEMFRIQYGNVFEGDESWKSLPTPEGELFEWDPDSTYVREAPFFDDMPEHPTSIEDITDARVLAVLGDSVTTDHISPAGTIPVDSPAGEYLISKGVQPKDFNSYGSRRGNHEVMIRGTFANIRLRNRLAPGTEGGWTTKLPEKKQMTIYDASIQYSGESRPLIVLAGKEYGSGSSRDWAAKGTLLLGIRAIIAESYERIHRSNLIGMGVLPLQYLPGESAQTLGLTGQEVYTITGIADGLEPDKKVSVKVTDDDGKTKEFIAVVRIDTLNELEYYKHGGILQYVLRALMKA